MTTPDPRSTRYSGTSGGGGAGWLAQAEAASAQAAEAPDAGLIAQLANQFFSAMPGGGLPAGVLPLGAPPAPLQSPGLPHPPLGPSATALASPAVVPAVGLPIEGVPEPINLAAVPSSLTGVMSLVSLSASAPGPGLGLGVPSAPGFAALPAGPSADDASLPAAGLPTLPGAFYFIDEALAAASRGTTPFTVDRTDLKPPAAGIQPAGVPASGFSTRPFNPNLIRADFPLLNERVNGRRLVWLDNAATTQKPQAVIDRLKYFYEHENSNIHRAAHTLAARSTDAYEAAREKVRGFLNAASSEEIIFVRGATEGINLIAETWGVRNVGEGDEILITWLEHHANIVPWQQLANEKGATLKVAPVDDDGQIILAEYERLLGPKTRLVALTQVSNALGTITPAKAMIEAAHRHGACVLVDGAQSVSHLRSDVQALDADFFVFSGHKVFGPTGIGVVYGKKAILDTMPPWQGGGNMIADVTFEKTVYQPAPFKFEAGTGNIADAVGLGAALDYVQSIGIENIAAYEHELLVYATQALKSVPGLTLIGTAKDKAGVLSFVLDGFKTEEVGALLDKEGIAVRSGHHCAQPILRRFGLESTVRPSLAPYNTCEDIDALVAALLRIQGGRAGHRA